LAGALYVCSFLSMPLSALLSGPLEEGAAICFPAPLGESAPLCVPLLAFSCTYCIQFLLMFAWLAWVGYGLLGAVSVLQGRDFRYVWLGPRLERYLEQG